MASISFLYGLLLIMLISHVQAMQKRMVDGGSCLSLEKVQGRPNFEAVDPRAAEAVYVQGIGGRKLMVLLKKDEILVKEKEDIYVINSDKINRPKKQIKRDDSNLNIGRFQHQYDMKVRVMGTFMALNADYHVPKPHPPKNN